MLRRYILFLKKHPLITAVIAIVYALVCLKYIKSQTYFQMLLMRTLLCGAMAFFLYQISGDKTLASGYHSTFYVIKVAMGYWIFAFPLGWIAFAGNAANDYPLWENPTLQLITVFGMFLFVGLFEEMAFRAVINDAIIYQFRNRKYVFVFSALACSLTFGSVHVIGSDLSSLAAWGQALGKTISTAVFGLALLVLYWKTRNIWACGVVHGVYDFLLSFSIGILKVPDSGLGNYVFDDSMASAAILIYAIDTLINLLIFLVIWKIVGRKIDFEKIREEW